MNRNQAKEILPFIQAFAEGKEIQKTDGYDWYDLDDPDFMANGNSYRIKPGPKYCPFKNAEECLQEMLKHQPFGWITYRCAFFYVIYIEDKLIGYGSACGTILHTKFSDSLKQFKFADGTSFGVKVEK